MTGGRHLDHIDKKAINDFCLALTNKITAAIPPRLWHYTTAEGFIGVLTSKKLRANHITAMNDAYEYRYSIGSLAQATDFRLQHNHEIPAEARSMLQRMRDALAGVTLADIPPVFVSCFTAEVDQANHWGEYGDRGKGYALGFNTTELVKIAAEQDIFILPCVYQDKDVAEVMVACVVEAERIFMIVRGKRLNVPLTELINDFLQFYT